MRARRQTRSAAAPSWRPATPPPTRDLGALRRAAAACTECPLHLTGTQTVLGDGAADAEVVLVGEQPGDHEDREGRPFVGPAGRVLDRALADAGMDRQRCWVTNAVKHFKWEARGKRRIHQKPTARETAACRPWLEAELAALRPRLVVLLGATAARAVLGPTVRVLRDRAVVRDSPLGPPALMTVHPSSLLRAPDEETARVEYARFVADLQVAARFLRDAARPAVTPDRSGSSSSGSCSGSARSAGPARSPRPSRTSP